MNRIDRLRQYIEIEYDNRTKYTTNDGSEELSLHNKTVYYELKELLNDLLNSGDIDND